MAKIAITGRIGSGKSLVLDYFRQRGHFVISSDFLIKEIYENSNYRDPLLKLLEIKSKDFKKEIIEKLKIPNFNYKLKRHIYPLMNKLRKRKIPYHDSKKNMFFEVPLLFEEKLEHKYDLIILVKSNYNNRLKRLLSKGMTKDYFKTMNDYQGSDESKEKKCDITVINNGSRNDFYERLHYCNKKI